MAIPSLAMIPSGYKATKLYSVLPTDGVGDFTVARASTATRVNSAGLIETVGADVPRLDYSDGGCPVLLTEPQSKNEYLNSQVMVTQTVTTTADEYTVSFYGTGTIALSGTFTGSLVGTGVNDLVQLTFTATSGGLVSTVTGNVNESQLEKLSYATSRIRTEGTTVTRVADVVSDAGDVNTFKSSEGTLFLHAKCPDDNTNQFMGLVENTSSGDYIAIYGSGSNDKWSASVRRGADVYYFSTSGFFDKSVMSKIAVVWSGTSLTFYINGTKGNTQTILSPFPTNIFNNLTLDFSGVDFYGETKEIQVFNTELTEAEAITLTTL
jgi:hypothetical protein